MITLVLRMMFGLIVLEIINDVDVVADSVLDDDVSCEKHVHIFDCYTCMMMIVTGGRSAQAGWGMIKWLTGAPPRARDLVTDDPLATITPRPYQVYAVTRYIHSLSLI